MARDGTGIVAAPSGAKLRVRGVVPGQRVRVLQGGGGRRRRGAVEEILAPGPAQVEAPCPHVRRCGGCSFQEWDYQAQLDYLGAMVSSALADAGIEADVPPVLPAPSPFGYRNKMEFTFGDVRWVEPDEPEDAPRDFALGMHLPGRWNRVLDIHSCAIAHPRMLPVVESVRERARSRGLLPWSPRERRGTLRHLVVRAGVRTGDLLVNLVTSGEQPDEVGQLLGDVQGDCPEITSIVETVNRSAASVAAGEEERVHSGSGFLRERILGTTFLISAGSFFQTNTEQAERLFETVLAAADPVSGDRVLDVFCGSGVIGLLLAPRVLEVEGYEYSASAVGDAERNARFNGIGNARFIVGDVAETLAEGRPPGTVDLVVLDPPRAGVHPRALRSIAAARPRRIVYVSCNAESAARDLRTLLDAGFRLDRVDALDLFPHTPHVECVFALSR